MQKKLILLAIILPLNVTLLACSETPATDADTTTQASSGDAIAMRQDMMKNWKDASEIMGDMIDNPDTFDAETFKTQAQFLANDAGNAWQHFTNQAERGDATEAVWSNPEEFQAKAQKYETAAINLNAVAQTTTSVADIQPAYAELKDSCKECHQTFKD